jgi:hypothetical protein
LVSKLECVHRNIGPPVDVSEGAVGPNRFPETSVHRSEDRHLSAGAADELDGVDVKAASQLDSDDRLVGAQRYDVLFAGVAAAFRSPRFAISLNEELLI